jgi:hypothetical protein
MKGIQKIKNQRRVQMKNRNGSQEKLVDGIGWGLFLILIGGLLFADNKGWINEHGWLYFAIGLGSILIIGGLVRYFIGQDNRWKSIGGLVTGLALIYVGVAFLFGFGDWWPLAFVPVGLGYLVKAIWSHKPASYTT